MSVPGAHQSRFRLRLQPTAAGDGWGFTLDELTGDRSHRVLRVPSRRAVRYRRDVIEAVTASGYAPAAVSPSRCRPFHLSQEPGVRLALTVGALEPLRDPLRRLRVHDRVASLGSEEALYWYAQTSGTSGGRGLRALRILTGA